MVTWTISDVRSMLSQSAVGKCRAISISRKWPPYHVNGLLVEDRLVRATECKRKLAWDGTRSGRSRLRLRGAPQHRRPESSSQEHPESSHRSPETRLLFTTFSFCYPCYLCLFFIGQHFFSAKTNSITTNTDGRRVLRALLVRPAFIDTSHTSKISLLPYVGVALPGF